MYKGRQLTRVIRSTFHKKSRVCMKSASVKDSKSEVRIGTSIQQSLGVQIKGKNKKLKIRMKKFNYLLMAFKMIFLPK